MKKEKNWSLGADGRGEKKTGDIGDGKNVRERI